MKENIDLTEGRDFREDQKITDFFQPRYLRYLRRETISPHWTGACLTRPDLILRKAGIRTLSGYDDFPPKDRCMCCGRLISPWKGDLCKRCESHYGTPADEEKGLPREEPMKSVPEVLWR